MALCQFQPLRRAVADDEAGDFDVLPCQSRVDSARQGLSAGKILNGTSSNDNQCAPGGLPEEFSVGGQGNGLGAVFSDAPVVIYRYDQFHISLLNKQIFSGRATYPLVFVL